MILLILLSLLAFIFFWGACAVGGRADEITDQIYRNEMEKRDECS